MIEKAIKNLTKNGKQRGRPRKGVSGYKAERVGRTADKPINTGRGRSAELTTIRIIDAYRSKRPGYAERLREWRRDEGLGLISIASVKRQVSRDRKKIRLLTGVDGPAKKTTIKTKKAK